MAGVRIHVIGASGSGTSTVGRSLASAFSIAHFDSDDYYHAPSDPPFQNPRSSEERCDLIHRDLSPEANWVLSGGIVGWSPIPLLEFTCVAFLYVPTETRVKRLRQREQERFGDRILRGGDMHDAHEEFISWAASYDAGNIEGKTLAKDEAYLRSQTCKVLEFRGTYSVEGTTKMMLKYFAGDE